MLVFWLDPTKDNYVRALELCQLPPEADIVFRILEIKRNRVKVGIIAPPSVKVLRKLAEAKRGLVNPDSAG